MRHRNSGRKLNRTSSHRKMMFSNMCNALIEHELIKTTLAKAKDLRGYIEPLITVSKTDSVATRRYIFDRLRSKSAVGKLFTTLGPRYMERPGGYVRVLKCGYRTGDSAPMAIVELVDRVLDSDSDVEVAQEEAKTEKVVNEKKASKKKSAAESTPKNEQKKESKHKEDLKAQEQDSSPEPKE